MGDAKTVSEIIHKISPHYAKTKKPDIEHTLVYDSSSETLEPLYFFIIDLLETFGYPPQKLVDNFTSSPGSGHFGELGQRSSIMQQQGTQLLANINTVLRSVLNIVYDLKEFKIRLQHYEDLRSKNKDTVSAARLSLKQLWMDKVDALKGNSGIKAMALSQAGFQTLIDAFLASNTLVDVKNLDLNDRVKRILTPRLTEFNAWVEESEKELRKRYELEKTYLRSQVNSLKLYSRWAKPYLKAASELENKDFGRDPGLVKVFNTMLLELNVVGKQKIKVKDLALEGSLPAEFQKESFLKSLKRDYYSYVVIDFKFRGIPNKVQGTQHYSFGGKAEVTFKGYALNDDELARLDQELEESHLGDALKLIEGSTTESISHLQDEINAFLDETDQPEKPEKPTNSSNPFLALLGFYNKEEKSEKPKVSSKEKIIVKKDSWIESEHLRKAAIAGVKVAVFNLFDVYKKGHGMLSYT